MSYNLEVHSQDSVLLHIDSRDASRYLQSDITSYYQFLLKDKVICPENQSLLVSLHSASIPYSFYNIRTQTNNTIDLRISDYTTGSPVGTQTAVLSLPAANYNAFSIADIISTSIPSLFVAHYSFVINISYDNDTNKLTFNLTPTNADAAKVLRLEFLFSTGDNTKIACFTELGFKIEDVFMDKDTNLTSTNCLDINGSIHGIFIRTNLTSKSILDSQNGNLSNILGRVPIDIQPGGVIFHRARDSIFHSIVKSKDITNLTIKLTDERNRLLDLNGLHFQVGIKIDFLYDRPKNPEPTREERRVKGVRKEQQEEKQLEQALYNESEATRQKLAELVESGGAEVVEEDDKTITIRKKTKSVGRPRKVGRPTDKEQKRRDKQQSRKEEDNIQDKLYQASKKFYTDNTTII